MKLKTIFLIGSFSVFVSFHQAALAETASACEPQETAAAFKSGQTNKLEQIYVEATKSSTSCQGQAAFCTGRMLALSLLAEAGAAMEKNQGDRAAVFLERAAHYGAPWQVLIAEGDVAFEEAKGEDKNAYTKAATYYERALDDLAEQPACSAYGEPGAPAPSEIAELHKRMTEAKLLAPSFEVVHTRDGACGGVFLKNIRGFEPESAPLPIEFEFNSVALTPKGEKAAEGLIECVSARKFSKIHFTGHTDRIGSDSENMVLSKRRLEAIKALLIKSGVPSQNIELEPKGKREPFVPDDAGKYTQPEIDQMNRRVELKDASE
jgi:outer membrane protein OmpA-like peptidoglycan-associated protein